MAWQSQPSDQVYQHSFHDQLLNPNSKEAEGFREEWGWGGEEDRREIQSNCPAQHRPVKSQQTWLRPFVFRTVPLELSTSILLLQLFSNSQPDFLQCVLSWVTSVGRVSSSDHSRERRNYRGINARLGEPRGLDEKQQLLKGGNPNSLQGKLDLAIKCPCGLTGHL